MKTLLLPLLLGACTGSGDDSGKGGEATCDASDLFDAGTVTVTVGEDVATVATLDLTLAAAADVTVTMEADGAPTVDTPTWTDLEGEQALPLYGMRPDTTYTVRVKAASGDACQEAETSVTTGSLPAWIPTPTVATAGDAWGNWTLLSIIDNEGAHSGALIVDDEGVAVWAYEVPSGVAPFAAWDLDGTDVLLREDLRTDPANNEVYRVAMSGELVEGLTLPYSHHDLAQAPGIDFAYIQATARDIDGETIVGDRIVERGEDGVERVVWDAFDCMAQIERHDSWDVDSAVLDGGNWTLANGLSYCAADDTWLLSTYYLHEVHKIRRSDCSDVWVLDGDDGGDFAMDADLQFGPQHGPACTDDGVTLFDNHGGGGGTSRAMSLDLDTTGMVATADWVVDHPDGTYTPLLGESQPLPDGSTLVGWGGIGDVSVVDADGNITWRLDFGNYTLGALDRRESLYGP